MPFSMQMGIDMKHILKFVWMGALVCMASCSQHQKQNNGNAAADKQSGRRFEQSTALKTLLPEPEKLIVSSRLGGEIRTTDGSKILVAPNSFVYKDGSPVTGDVQLAYRPINDPASIIASGIPMQAMHNGEVGSFISDGMFEIGASAGGKEVSVVQGKALQVYTPVRDKESEFNYWFYNPKTAAWEDLGKRESLNDAEGISEASRQMGINAALSSYSHFQQGIFRLAAATPDAPVRTIPGKYDPSKAVLDISFNPKEYPDLAEYSKIMWQFAGTDPARDPENNRWLYQTPWTNVKLTPHPSRKMVFELKVSAGLRTFETEVRPVVSGKDLERAMALYNQEVQNESEKPDTKKEATAATINRNMYNAFRISQLGTYNCDRFSGLLEKDGFNSTFTFDGQHLAAGSTLYLLTDNRTSVLQVSANSGTIKVPLNIVDGIFTVIGTGAIAAVNQTALKAQKAGTNKSKTLPMERVKVKISNMGSLLEALKSL